MVFIRFFFLFVFFNSFVFPKITNHFTSDPNVRVFMDLFFLSHPPSTSESRSIQLCKEPVQAGAGLSASLLLTLRWPQCKKQSERDFSVVMPWKHKANEEFLPVLRDHGYK